MPVYSLTVMTKNIWLENMFVLSLSNSALSSPSIPRKVPSFLVKLIFFHKFSFFFSLPLFPLLFVDFLPLRFFNNFWIVLLRAVIFLISGLNYSFQFPFPRNQQPFFSSSLLVLFLFPLPPLPPTLHYHPWWNENFLAFRSFICICYRWNNLLLIFQNFSLALPKQTEQCKTNKKNFPCS